MIGIISYNFIKTLFCKKIYVSLTLQKSEPNFYKNTIKSIAYKVISYRFFSNFSNIRNHLYFSQENPIPGTVTLTKSDLQKRKILPLLLLTQQKEETFLDGVVNMKAKEYENLTKRKKQLHFMTRPKFTIPILNLKQVELF